MTEDKGNPTVGWSLFLGRLYGKTVCEPWSRKCLSFRRPPHSLSSLPFPSRLLLRWLSHGFFFFFSFVSFLPWGSWLPSYSNQVVQMKEIICTTGFGDRLVEG